MDFIFELLKKGDKYGSENQSYEFLRAPYAQLHVINYFPSEARERVRLCKLVDRNFAKSGRFLSIENHHKYQILNSISLIYSMHHIIVEHRILWSESVGAGVGVWVMFWRILTSTNSRPQR